VVTRLDLATLRAVAERGGGEVLEIGSPDHGPASFRAALERLEQGELERRLTVQYEDRYALLAFPGFLALLGALLLPEARRAAARPDDGDARDDPDESDDDAAGPARPDRAAAGAER
jgi:hypothetical protein